MTNVLLAHAFFLDNDTKQREEKFRPYSPLATLYAAAILRDAGFDVGLFDATLEKEDGSFELALRQHRPRLLVIYEDSFNFLSKMCLMHVRDATMRMVETARAQGIPVIISSSDATDHPDIYLNSGANAVMLGEAENTIEGLAGHLLMNSPEIIECIPGLAYLDNRGRLMKTGHRHTERKPDRFPLPARDLLDIARYREAWLRNHGRFSMNMVTTRGCPYSCTWCAKPIWGKSYAVRSPASVAEELSIIKNNYAPDHIWFSDDIFGLKPGWVEAYAGEVSKHNAMVPFMIQSRADLMDADTVNALAAAGCEEVWMGAESGSQKVLDAMKKGITVEQIHRARRLLGVHDIRACFFIQFGYPCETLEDIEATIELVRTALPDDIGVSVSYPLPGTEFYDLVRHELRGKSNWRESNDLDIMFKGTFKSGYYRRLGKFLHRDLNARLGKNGNGTDMELATLDAEWRHLIAESESQRNQQPTALAAG
jgi:radical SAM superfamily enzyme YgiQ (UPF0313 family)